MKLDDLKSQIVQNDVEDLESVNREDAADTECTAAKAAADADFNNEVLAASQKRHAAYVAADEARKVKRHTERDANAERSTEIKGAFQDAYGHLDFQNGELVKRAKALEPFKDLVATTMDLLNPPPPAPGEMTIETREVVPLNT